MNTNFRAHIRTVMVTGDNIFTALSVARECGIIQPMKKAYIVECGNRDSPNSRIPLLLKQVWDLTMSLWYLFQ